MNASHIEITGSLNYALPNMKLQEVDFRNIKKFHGKVGEFSTHFT